MGDPSAMLERLSISNSNNISQEEDFKKVESLGSGAFGRVDLCTIERGKTYAKKGDQVVIKKSYLDHFKDSKGQLAIVMEYCNKGTLEDWMADTGLWMKYPESGVWRLVYEFSAALSFLHAQRPPVLHNDLKPANILCQTGSIEIKIADFGLCNVLGQIPCDMYYQASPDGETPCYLAPEVLRGDDPHIAASADMWSLGAVITFVANDGEHLFRNDQDVFKWKGEKSPLKKEFKYPELHTLVLSLLSVDKHKRPSSKEVLKDSSNTRSWKLFGKDH